MSNAAEKALLREIDLLKKALPDMKNLSKVDPELQTIREEKKKISGMLDIVKRVIDDKEDKIQGVKQASQIQRDKRDEVRQEGEKFTEVIEKNSEEMQNAFKTKDKMRESYYKALYEYELQNDKNRWIKGLVRQ